mmetsp:Transcript_9135/g.13252  ORF Transcript_9135/g.13252 Transcript_9135/m.13252 type:complete len:115 (-) Transcript_9135:838-1182(-)
MSTAASLVVAGLHFGFFVLESILWTKPTGRKIFRNSEEKAKLTKVLAANQGVYNLGLCAGLAYAVASGNSGAVSLLLTYVVGVGLYGAATVSKTIFYVQVAPALIALALKQGGY